MAGVSVRTVRRHIKDGWLPVSWSGSKIYITPRQARAWRGHDLPLWRLWPVGAPAWISVRAYAALLGWTERQARHYIDEVRKAKAKGPRTIAKIGGRIMIDFSRLDPKEFVKRPAPDMSKFANFKSSWPELSGIRRVTPKI
jgi:hypothetical protein